ncbi:amine-terminal region of chorein, A TM vesicle-mediated sorter [Gregarina niphandrodes]|uniref:Amine-terminal region of chorein, A TM vesicle-mediated sorter n=1 Tax=Gregarina niphandrodes TaxID=110365 RepID=A0A023BCZ8_GRENI|nr:amine-terminal region of chorein, A TM vesicle-mediated sorter [Gregarina niphandrodes]EZG87024.1 amine-terminal region of chorein, A TM vesicle-mediated sorter [Gregarina niphandrodes]|eukprot:XP_011128716.1 amine-terminal region of chorein, A TM vesicle-mediated sorter [Gregarina niphandrodes]
MASMLDWLLGYVHRYIENFMEPITGGQLSLAGLLLGKLTIENVQLKQKIMDFMPMPMNLHFQYIGTIKLSLPIWSLFTSPIHVEVKDVIMVVGTKQLKDWNKEAWEASYLPAKKQLLAGNEGSAFVASMEDGFLWRTLIRLGSNVKVEVSNVQVRFEDWYGCSKPYALGATVQSLFVSSVHNEIIPKAEHDYARTGHAAYSDANIIRKQVDIQGVSVYCDQLVFPEDSPVPAGGLTGKLTDGKKRCIAFRPSHRVRGIALGRKSVRRPPGGSPRRDEPTNVASAAEASGAAAAQVANNPIQAGKGFFKSMWNWVKGEVAEDVTNGDADTGGGGGVSGGGGSRRSPPGQMHKIGQIPGTFSIDGRFPYRDVFGELCEVRLYEPPVTGAEGHWHTAMDLLDEVTTANNNLVHEEDAAKAGKQIDRLLGIHQTNLQKEMEIGAINRTQLPPEIDPSTKYKKEKRKEEKPDPKKRFGLMQETEVKGLPMPSLRVRADRVNEMKALMHEALDAFHEYILPPRDLTVVLSLCLLPVESRADNGQHTLKDRTTEATRNFIYRSMQRGKEQMDVEEKPSFWKDKLFGWLPKMGHGGAQAQTMESMQDIGHRLDLDAPVAVDEEPERGGQTLNLLPMCRVDVDVSTMRLTLSTKQIEQLLAWVEIYGNLYPTWCTGMIANLEKPRPPYEAAQLYLDAWLVKMCLMKGTVPPDTMEGPWPVNNLTDSQKRIILWCSKLELAYQSASILALRKEALERWRHDDFSRQTANGNWFSSCCRRPSEPRANTLEATLSGVGVKGQDLAAQDAKEIQELQVNTMEELHKILISETKNSLRTIVFSTDIYVNLFLADAQIYLDLAHVSYGPASTVGTSPKSGSGFGLKTGTGSEGNTPPRLSCTPIYDNTIDLGILVEGVALNLMIKSDKPSGYMSLNCDVYGATVLTIANFLAPVGPTPFETLDSNSSQKQEQLKQARARLLKHLAEGRMMADEEVMKFVADSLAAQTRRQRGNVWRKARGSKDLASQTSIDLLLMVHRSGWSDDSEVRMTTPRVDNGHHHHHRLVQFITGKSGSAMSALSQFLRERAAPSLNCKMAMHMYRLPDVPDMDVSIDVREDITVLAVIAPLMHVLQAAVPLMEVLAIKDLFHLHRICQQVDVVKGREYTAACATGDLPHSSMKVEAHITSAVQLVIPSEAHPICEGLILTLQGLHFTTPHLSPRKPVVEAIRLPLKEQQDVFSLELHDLEIARSSQCLTSFLKQNTKSFLGTDPAGDWETVVRHYMRIINKSEATVSESVILGTENQMEAKIVPPAHPTYPTSGCPDVGMLEIFDAGSSPIAGTSPIGGTSPLSADASPSSLNVSPAAFVGTPLMNPSDPRGLSPNGLSPNGLSPNGLSPDGLSPNGTVSPSLTGVSGEGESLPQRSGLGHTLKRKLEDSIAKHRHHREASREGHGSAAARLMERLGHRHHRAPEPVGASASELRLPRATAVAKSYLLYPTSIEECIIRMTHLPARYSAPAMHLDVFLGRLALEVNSFDLALLSRIGLRAGTMYGVFAPQMGVATQRMANAAAQAEYIIQNVKPVVPMAPVVKVLGHKNSLQFRNRKSQLQPEGGGGSRLGSGLGSRLGDRGLGGRGSMDRGGLSAGRDSTDRGVGDRRVPRLMVTGPDDERDALESHARSRQNVGHQSASHRSATGQSGGGQSSSGRGDESEASYSATALQQLEEDIDGLLEESDLAEILGARQAAAEFAKSGHMDLEVRPEMLVAEDTHRAVEQWSRLSKHVEFYNGSNGVPGNWKVQARSTAAGTTGVAEDSRSDPDGSLPESPSVYSASSSPPKQTLCSETLLPLGPQLWLPRPDSGFTIIHCKIGQISVLVCSVPDDIPNNLPDRVETEQDEKTRSAWNPHVTYPARHFAYNPYQLTEPLVSVHLAHITAICGFGAKGEMTARVCVSNLRINEEMGITPLNMSYLYLASHTVQPCIPHTGYVRNWSGILQDEGLKTIMGVPRQNDDDEMPLVTDPIRELVYYTDWYSRECVSGHEYVAEQEEHSQHIRVNFIGNLTDFSKVFATVDFSPFRLTLPLEFVDELTEFTSNLALMMLSLDDANLTAVDATDEGAANLVLPSFQPVKFRSLEQGVEYPQLPLPPLNATKPIEDRMVEKGHVQVRFSAVEVFIPVEPIRLPKEGPKKKAKFGFDEPSGAMHLDVQQRQLNEMDRRLAMMTIYRWKEVVHRTLRNQSQGMGASLSRKNQAVLPLCFAIRCGVDVDMMLYGYSSTLRCPIELQPLFQDALSSRTTSRPQISPDPSFDRMSVSDLDENPSRKQFRFQRTLDSYRWVEACLRAPISNQPLIRQVCPGQVHVSATVESITVDFLRPSCYTLFSMPKVAWDRQTLYANVPGPGLHPVEMADVSKNPLLSPTSLRLSLELALPGEREMYERFYGFSKIEAITARRLFGIPDDSPPEYIKLNIDISPVGVSMNETTICQLLKLLAVGGDLGAHLGEKASRYALMTEMLCRYDRLEATGAPDSDGTDDEKPKAGTNYIMRDDEPDAQAMEKRSARGASFNQESGAAINLLDRGDNDHRGGGPGTDPTIGGKFALQDDGTESTQHSTDDDDDAYSMTQWLLSAGVPPELAPGLFGFNVSTSWELVEIDFNMPLVRITLWDCDREVGFQKTGPTLFDIAITNTRVQAVCRPVSSLSQPPEWWGEINSGEELLAGTDLIALSFVSYDFDPLFSNPYRIKPIPKNGLYYALKTVAKNYYATYRISNQGGGMQGLTDDQMDITFRGRIDDIENKIAAALPWLCFDGGTLIAINCSGNKQSETKQISLLEPMTVRFIGGKRSPKSQMHVTSEISWVNLSVSLFLLDSWLKFAQEVLCQEVPEEMSRLKLQAYLRSCHKRLNKMSGFSRPKSRTVSSSKSKLGGGNAFGTCTTDSLVPSFIASRAAMSSVRHWVLGQPRETTPAMVEETWSGVKFYLRPLGCWDPHKALAKTFTSISQSLGATFFAQGKAIASGQYVATTDFPLLPDKGIREVSKTDMAAALLTNLAGGSAVSASPGKALPVLELVNLLGQPLGVYVKKSAASDPTLEDWHVVQPNQCFAVPVCLVGQEVVLSDFCLRLRLMNEVFDLRSTVELRAFAESVQSYISEELFAQKQGKALVKKPKGRVNYYTLSLAGLAQAAQATQTAVTQAETPSRKKKRCRTKLCPNGLAIGGRRKKPGHVVGEIGVRRKLPLLCRLRTAMLDVKLPVANSQRSIDLQWGFQMLLSSTFSAKNMTQESLCLAPISPSVSAQELKQCAASMTASCDEIIQAPTGSTFRHWLESRECAALLYRLPPPAPPLDGEPDWVTVPQEATTAVRRAATLEGAAALEGYLQNDLSAQSDDSSGEWQTIVQTLRRKALKQPLIDGISCLLLPANNNADPESTLDAPRRNSVATGSPWPARCPRAYPLYWLLAKNSYVAAVDPRSFKALKTAARTALGGPDDPALGGLGHGQGGSGQGGNGNEPGGGADSREQGGWGREHGGGRDSVPENGGLLAPSSRQFLFYLASQPQKLGPLMVSREVNRLLAHYETLASKSDIASLTRYVHRLDPKPRVMKLAVAKASEPTAGASASVPPAGGATLEEAASPASLSGGVRPDFNEAKHYSVSQSVVAADPYMLAGDGVCVQTVIAPLFEFSNRLPRDVQVSSARTARRIARMARMEMMETGGVSSISATDLGNVGGSTYIHAGESHLLPLAENGIEFTFGSVKTLGSISVDLRNHEQETLELVCRAVEPSLRRRMRPSKLADLRDNLLAPSESFSKSEMDKTTVVLEDGTSPEEDFNICLEVSPANVQTVGCGGEVVARDTESVVVNCRCYMKTLTLFSDLWIVNRLSYPLAVKAKPAVELLPHKRVVATAGLSRAGSAKMSIDKRTFAQIPGAKYFLKAESIGDALGDALGGAIGEAIGVKSGWRAGFSSTASVLSDPVKFSSSLSVATPVDFPATDSTPALSLLVWMARAPAPFLRTSTVEVMPAYVFANDSDAVLYVRESPYKANWMKDQRVEHGAFLAVPPGARIEFHPQRKKKNGSIRIQVSALPEVERFHQVVLQQSANKTGAVNDADAPLWSQPIQISNAQVIQLRYPTIDSPAVSVGAFGLIDISVTMKNGVRLISFMPSHVPEFRLCNLSSVALGVAQHNLHGPFEILKPLAARRTHNLEHPALEKVAVDYDTVKEGMLIKLVGGNKRSDELKQLEAAFAQMSEVTDKDLRAWNAAKQQFGRLFELNKHFEQMRRRKLAGGTVTDRLMFLPVPGGNIVPIRIKLRFVSGVKWLILENFRGQLPRVPHHKLRGSGHPGGPPPGPPPGPPRGHRGFEQQAAQAREAEETAKREFEKRRKVNELWLRMQGGQDCAVELATLCKYERVQLDEMQRVFPFGSRTAKDTFSAAFEKVTGLKFVHDLSQGRGGQGAQGQGAQGQGGQGQGGQGQGRGEPTTEGGVLRSDVSSASSATPSAVDIAGGATTDDAFEIEPVPVPGARVKKTDDDVAIADGDLIVNPLEDEVPEVSSTFAADLRIDGFGLDVVDHRLSRDLLYVSLARIALTCHSDGSETFKLMLSVGWCQIDATSNDSYYPTVLRPLRDLHHNAARAAAEDEEHEEQEQPILILPGETSQNTFAFDDPKLFDPLLLERFGGNENFEFLRVVLENRMAQPISDTETILQKFVAHTRELDTHKKKPREEQDAPPTPVQREIASANRPDDDSSVFASQRGAVVLPPSVGPTASGAALMDIPLCAIDLCPIAVNVDYPLIQAMMKLLDHAMVICDKYSLDLVQGDPSEIQQSDRQPYSEPWKKYLGGTDCLFRTKAVLMKVSLSSLDIGEIQLILNINLGSRGVRKLKRGPQSSALAAATSAEGEGEWEESGTSSVLKKTSDGHEMMSAFVQGNQDPAVVANGELAPGIRPEDDEPVESEFVKAILGVLQLKASLSDAQIQLPSMQYRDLTGPSDEVAMEIITPYITKAAKQVAKVLGAIDLFGNPSLVVRHCTGGVSRAITEVRFGCFRSTNSYQRLHPNIAIRSRACQQPCLAVFFALRHSVVGLSSALLECVSRCLGSWTQLMETASRNGDQFSIRPGATSKVNSGSIIDQPANIFEGLRMGLSTGLYLATLSLTNFLAKPCRGLVAAFGKKRDADLLDSAGYDSDDDEELLPLADADADADDNDSLLEQRFGSRAAKAAGTISCAALSAVGSCLFGLPSALCACCSLTAGGALQNIIKIPMLSSVRSRRVFFRPAGNNTFQTMRQFEPHYALWAALGSNSARLSRFLGISRTSPLLKAHTNVVLTLPLATLDTKTGQAAPAVLLLGTQKVGLMTKRGVRWHLPWRHLALVEFVAFPTPANVPHHHPLVTALRFTLAGNKSTEDPFVILNADPTIGWDQFLLAASLFLDLSPPA